MNGVRINTAYGAIPQYQATVEAVREVAEIPIILDLKGPEVRLKAKEQKNLKVNDQLEVGFNGEQICFNHNFYDQVNVGDVILIDNGKIKTEIYPSLDKLDKQLKYADKKNIPYVLIIGPEEVKKDVVKLKNMKTGEQEEMKIEEVIKFINPKS